MAKKLKDCFPMIREEKELLAEIRESETLRRTFQGWPEEKQRIFLDCCTGARGVKMLYDSFFKEIMNPEKNPERIEELLSLLLDRQVRILKVLPLEGTRLAGAHSLVIMDIVVELEGGSLANVEVQKLGYRFPGQRSACYSAFSCGSTKGCGRRNGNGSTTGISRRFIPWSCLSRARGNSTGIRRSAATGSVRNRTPGWNWICCRNSALFRLTFSSRSITIKVSGTDGMRGWFS